MNVSRTLVYTTLAISFIVLLSGASGVSVTKQQPSFIKHSGKSAAVAPDVECAGVRSEQLRGKQQIKSSGAPAKGKAPTTSIPVSPDHRVTSNQRPDSATKKGESQCHKIPAGVVDVNITTRKVQSSVDMIRKELRKDAAGKNYLRPKTFEARRQAQIKADELSKCLGYNMSNTGHQCILLDVTISTLLKCNNSGRELPTSAIDLLTRIRRSSTNKGLYVLCHLPQQGCHCDCLNEIPSFHDRLSVVGQLLKRFVGTLPSPRRQKAPTTNGKLALKQKLNLDERVKSSFITS